MSLHLSDKAAKELGAIAYHDEIIVKWTPYGNPSTSRFHFSRHYFNVRGVEIAYVIPCLLQFHEPGHLAIFDTPREWGIPHDMTPLKVSWSEDEVDQYYAGGSPAS